MYPVIKLVQLVGVVVVFATTLFTYKPINSYQYLNSTLIFLFALFCSIAFVWQYREEINFSSNDCYSIIFAVIPYALLASVVEDYTVLALIAALALLDSQDSSTSYVHPASPYLLAGSCFAFSLAAISIDHLGLIVVAFYAVYLLALSIDFGFDFPEADRVAGASLTLLLLVVFIRYDSALFDHELLLKIVLPIAAIAPIIALISKRTSENRIYTYVALPTAMMAVLVVS